MEEYDRHVLENKQLLKEATTMEAVFQQLDKNKESEEKLLFDLHRRFKEKITEQEAMHRRLTEKILDLQQSLKAAEQANREMVAMLRSFAVRSSTPPLS
jgi:hypothetical protein